MSQSTRVLAMSEENTTAAVQLYLNALAGDQPAEPITALTAV